MRLVAAHPPADPRGRPGFQRQFLRPGSISAVRGRPRPSRRDLQQDDGGTPPPARRAHGGERPDRPPAALHRSRAGRRLGGRARPRRAGRSRSLNRSAEEILGVGAAELLGPAGGALPEIADLIAGSPRRASAHLQGQVMLVSPRAERTLVVYASPSRRGMGPTAHGGDPRRHHRSRLGAAHLAWADVARRIAHEIKNPLTPIQLSAERLRSGVRPRHHRGPEVFDQCTATIVRQVDDIGRMVDEFSSFARMPKPVAGAGGHRRHRAAGGVHDADRQSRDRRSSTTFPKGRPASFDRRLISQALTNIIKNATEAIAAVPEEQRGIPGRILVRLTAEEALLRRRRHRQRHRSADKENRHRLLEPYVTTREKRHRPRPGDRRQDSRGARRGARPLRRSGGQRRTAARGPDPSQFQGPAAGGDDRRGGMTKNG
jgi:hypothetical protein